MEQSKNQSIGLSQAGIFMQHVYTWMFTGLLVTAAVAYVCASSMAILQFVASGVGLIVFAVSTIGLVFYLSSRIHQLSAQQATGYFLLYTALMGAFLSPILIIYTGASIASTFVITALMFGSLAVYGMTTKRDLSAMGSFMMMGLVGLILASLVNIFLASSAMQFIINVVGVIIFAGLTAWDNQKIRQMGETAPIEDSVALRRGAILGALTLYMDFINLFLFMLRFLGQQRD